MQGCAQNCLKFILVFLNLLIFLCGVGLIVTGTFLALGFTDWIRIEDVANLLQNDLLRVGAYVIIAAGCFVIIVSGFGCGGACCENKCMLGVYFVLLLLIFCAQLAAGILAAIYSAEIKTFVTNEGVEFLKTNYNNTQNGTGSVDTYANELGTAAWNAIQEQLECCGVNGIQDYQENPYVNSAEITSCMSSDGSLREGCQQPLESLLEMYSTVIGATAIGVACLELFCMVFAVCLCRNVGQDD
ncbi:tetraspanin-18B-like [Lytechinus pictus]|uniref:tetraspanin-18B-like n=1 Tax=Lytechinus pictus TaxID=7653 RepID=UPI00240DF3DE|nr:tetraspanin-18-like [Lytechinus pictus]